MRGLLVDPVPRKKERGGRKDGQPEPAGPPFPGPRRRGRAGPGRTGRPPPGRAHPPLGKGATRPPPQRRPRADGTATTRRAPPSPSQPGARRPRRGGGPAGRKPPESAPTRRGVRPPSLRGDPTLYPHPSRQHHDPASPKGGTHTPSPPPRPAGRPTERARGHARARPANRSVARSGRGGPRATRRRSAGPRPARGDGEESGRTDGRTKAGASRTRAARPLFLTGVSDKPLCRGLTFNRSQRGSCSATYETPTQKQVVYEWFSTRFPTNVRCVTGEGAAPFPAAPRFPGRGALRTGPRSRHAAGHATPRGARAAARRRGRRGTGYPRPTEAPRRCRIVPPGRDSDLEAFSHNPTDGSFAPLAPQPSTYTKCLNLRFLSY